MTAASRPLFQPTIETDGGPWALHDMPCAVCRECHAVLDLNAGVFLPCWGCQRAGWILSADRGWPLSRYWLIAVAVLAAGALAAGFAHTWTGDQRWAGTAVSLLILGIGCGACWWFQGDAEDRR